MVPQGYNGGYSYDGSGNYYDNGNRLIQQPRYSPQGANPMEDVNQPDPVQQQMMLMRYKQDLEEAAEARRIREGRYKSADEMLLDPYGPAYQSIEDTPERQEQLDISVDGMNGPPLAPLTLRRREVRPEFKPALDALRPKSFQRDPMQSARPMSPIATALSAMNPDDMAAWMQENGVSSLDPASGRLVFEPKAPDYTGKADQQIRVEREKAGLAGHRANQNQQQNVLSTAAKIQAGGATGDINANQIAKDYITSATAAMGQPRQPVEMSVAPIGVPQQAKPNVRRKDFQDGSAIEMDENGQLFAVSPDGKQRKPITEEQAKKYGF